jgi:hypothetical protein
VPKSVTANKIAPHGAAVFFVVPRLPLGPTANALDGGRAARVAMAGRGWSLVKTLPQAETQ